MGKSKKKNNGLGCIYQRGNIWYWRVRLPGENNHQSLRLTNIDGEGFRGTRAQAEKRAELLYYEHIKKGSNPDPKSRSLKYICSAYLKYCHEYYIDPDGNPTKEPVNIEIRLRGLIKHYGDMHIEEFGPLKLSEFRDQLIASKKLCRKEINKRISMVKRLFKWAASKELVSGERRMAIESLENIHKGRMGTFDHPKRQAADIKDVNATLPYLPEVVADMVQIQMHTGMRPCELVRIKKSDIDQETYKNDSIWLYDVSKHKMSYKGKDRIIPLGLKCQKILTKYMFGPEDKYLFKSSTKRRKDIAEHYTTCYYSQQIKKAFRKMKKAKVKYNEWFPYQLRHRMGDLAGEISLEHEAAMLGHSDIETAKLYRRIQIQKAIEVQQKLG